MTIVNNPTVLLYADFRLTSTFFIKKDCLLSGYMLLSIHGLFLRVCMLFMSNRT